MKCWATYTLHGRRYRTNRIIGRFYRPIRSHFRIWNLKRFKIPLFRWKPQFLEKTFWKFLEKITSRNEPELICLETERKWNSKLQLNTSERQNAQCNHLEWPWMNMNTTKPRVCTPSALQMCTWSGNLWKLRSYQHVPSPLALLFQNMQ